MLLFPGYTLTIEPGVQVRFAAATNLTIRGTLVAEGTATNRIVFTSDNAAPAKGDWRGIEVATNQGGKASIKFANIEYGQTALSVECCWKGGPVNISDSVFTNNVIALGGYAGWVIQVDRSTFENNTYAVNTADKRISNSVFRNNRYGLYSTERISVYESTFTGHEVALYGGRGEVKYSTITSNGAGVQAFFEGFTLSYNTITSNAVGIILGQYDSYTPPLSYNNIYGNTGVTGTINISNTGQTNKDASNNWWGTTEASAIEAGIYDGRDNIAVGLINYQPFLSGPVDIAAPTPTPTPTATPVVTATPTATTTPTALPGGESRNSPKHLWGPGDSTKTDSRSVPPALPVWYHVRLDATSPSVQLSLTSYNDAVFDVFFGSETFPRVTNFKLFDIPTGAGDWYVQVRSLLGDYITLTATPMAMPSPTLTVTPTATATATPTPTVVATPTPTQTVGPSPTPVILPRSPSIIQPQTPTAYDRTVVSGISEQGFTTQLYVNGSLVGQTTAGNYGVWNFVNVPLALGANILYATATDQAGNTSLLSTPVVVDRVEVWAPPPAPVASAVITTTGGTVAAGNNVSVTVPAGALAEEVNLTLTPYAPVSAPGVFGVVSANAYTSITAVATASGAKLTSFQQPVTITIAYNPAALGGVPESSLQVSYYDEAIKGWVALPSVVDTVNHTVSAQTTHFSVYDAQVSLLTNRAYLPSLARGASGW